MKTPLTLAIAVFWITFCVAAAAIPSAAEEAPITVFVAKQIRTMEPAMPEAKVVAVSQGRILGVGRSIEDLSAWLEGRDVTLNDQFKDKILMPGFIDPHIHPLLGAIIFPSTFITPDRWVLPGEVVEPVKTPEAFRSRLAEKVAGDDTSPFITWGYHHSWHGPLTRADLDAISTKRPIVVWHRSFHEIIVNSKGLELMGFDPASDDPGPLPAGTDPHHVDLAKGHFKETGQPVAVARLQSVLNAPARIAQGLATLKTMAHEGGITTMADMGVGILGSINLEWNIMSNTFDAPDTSMRLMLVPMAPTLMKEAGSLKGAVALAKALPQKYQGRNIFFRNDVKLLADGAFFSLLMQMNPPGYTDGHEGEWLMPPEQLTQIGKAFWDEGLDIHIHVNGDKGVDAVLDALSSWQRATPRPEHRTSLEHFGYSTEDQNRRVAKLGATVSAQPYYLHVLGDKYAQEGLGYDRASQISRLGSLEAKGVPIALHSDVTMAPPHPLLLAWVAANRVTDEGTKLAPNERISVEKAMRAITIDAAYILGLENEIGSIRAGKKADFTVLEDDPFRVRRMKLKDIEVWGTVFEGEVYPAPK